MTIYSKTIVPVALAVLLGILFVGLTYRTGAPPEPLLSGLIGAGWAGCMIFALIAARSVKRRLRSLIPRMRAIIDGDVPPALRRESDRDEVDATASSLGDFAQEMLSVLESQQEMERIALTDSLTGLPNRRALFQLLEKLSMVGGPEVEDRHIGVMHIDLDHFKTVNDRLGHAAGDHVLVEATRRMSCVIRDTDVLARLGGDEFVILAPGIENLDALEGIAKRVIAQFDQPIAFRDDLCTVGASIGIVLGGSRGRVPDPNRLLISADTALCHAKENGRNRCVRFSSAMAKAIERRRQHTDTLRLALQNETVEPIFQPIVSLGDGDVMGVEVFSTWDCPEHGVLQADDLYVTGGEGNLAEELAISLFEGACKLAAALESENGIRTALHIGLSRTQLLVPGLADRLSWLIDDADIAPGGIVIGVSEQDFEGRSSELLITNINRLRALGCRTSLRGFGGHSGSISTILSCRADSIFMDPSFITVDPAAISDAKKMALGVAALGRELGVSVVAVGLDNPAVRTKAANLGIRYGRGNALAAEMTHKEVLDWMVSSCARASVTA